MRNLLMKSLAGCGLLLMSTGAFAQRRDFDDRNPGNMLERVRFDLNEAAEHSAFRRGDRSRIAHAREELNEFQNKMNAGRFDRHELDDVIGTLQRVVNDNRMDPRARDMLMGDLSQLREFRAQAGYNNNFRR